jgi:hypothetical protein
MSMAIREQEVNDDAADGKEEDKQCPDQLVRNWSARLQDLDYGIVSMTHAKDMHCYTYSRQ